MACNRLFASFALFSVLTLSACAETQNPWAVPSPKNSDIISQQAAPLPPEQSAANTALPSQPTGAPTKVALLVPLSGKGAETGTALLNAAQLALFDLGSNNFELLPKDTGASAESAATAANEAMAEGASLIIGPLFAEQVRSVSPIALQQGVNVLSFSTDQSVAGGNTFLMGFLPQTQVTRIVEFARKQNRKNIALIAPQDAYGTTIAAAFDTAVRNSGLSNGSVLRFSGSAPTAEQLSSFARAPFDAVLIATDAKRAATISQSLTSAGKTPALALRLGTGLWDNADAAAAPALQGAYYPASSPQLRAKFENGYKQNYGSAAPRLASLGYDATALALVLTRTNPKIDRNALLNANGFSGVDGIFRFNGLGLIERGLSVVQINNGQAILVEPPARTFQR